MNIINGHVARNSRRRLANADPTVDLGNDSGDWPYVNDNPDDGINTQALANLSPRNALHFWLRGYTNDPQFPVFGFDAANNRPLPRQPINEFDPLRLVPDRDANGAEYFPKADSTQQPYIYYRAVASAPEDAYLHAMQLANRVTATTYPAPYGVQRSAGSAGLYAAESTFQIISAGRDGTYRDTSVPLFNGDDTNRDNALVPILNKQGPSEFHSQPSDSRNKNTHADNIASFSDGTIGNFISD